MPVSQRKERPTAKSFRRADTWHEPQFRRSSTIVDGTRGPRAQTDSIVLADKKNVPFQSLLVRRTIYKLARNGIEDERDDIQTAVGPDSNLIVKISLKRIAVHVQKAVRSVHLQQKFIQSLYDLKAEKEQERAVRAKLDALTEEIQDTLAWRSSADVFDGSRTHPEVGSLVINAESVASQLTQLSTVTNWFQAGDELNKAIHKNILGIMENTKKYMDLLSKLSATSTNSEMLLTSFGHSFAMGADAMRELVVGFYASFSRIQKVLTAIDGEVDVCCTAGRRRSSAVKVLGLLSNMQKSLDVIVNSESIARRREMETEAERSLYSSERSQKSNGSKRSYGSKRSRKYNSEAGRSVDAEYTNVDTTNGSSLDNITIDLSTGALVTSDMSNVKANGDAYSSQDIALEEGSSPPQTKVTEFQMSNRASKDRESTADRKLDIIATADAIATGDRVKATTDIMVGEVLVVKVSTSGIVVPSDEECKKNQQVIVQFEHREDGNTGLVRVAQDEVKKAPGMKIETEDCMPKLDWHSETSMRKEESVYDILSSMPDDFDGGSAFTDVDTVADDISPEDFKEDAEFEAYSDIPSCPILDLPVSSAMINNDSSKFTANSTTETISPSASSASMSPSARSRIMGSASSVSVCRTLTREDSGWTKLIIDRSSNDHSTSRKVTDFESLTNSVAMTQSLIPEKVIPQSAQPTGSWRQKGSARKEEHPLDCFSYLHAIDPYPLDSLDQNLDVAYPCPVESTSQDDGMAAILRRRRQRETAEFVWPEYEFEIVKEGSTLAADCRRFRFTDLGYSTMVGSSTCRQSLIDTSVSAMSSTLRLHESCDRFKHKMNPDLDAPRMFLGTESHRSRIDDRPARMRLTSGTASFRQLDPGYSRSPRRLTAGRNRSVFKASLSHWQSSHPSAHLKSSVR